MITHFIPDIGNFYFLCVSLARDFSILLIISKESTLFYWFFFDFVDFSLLFPHLCSLYILHLHCCWRAYSLRYHLLNSLTIVLWPCKWSVLVYILGTHAKPSIPFFFPLSIFLINSFSVLTRVHVCVLHLKIPTETPL